MKHRSRGGPFMNNTIVVFQYGAGVRAASGDSLGGIPRS